LLKKGSKIWGQDELYKEDLPLLKIQETSSLNSSNSRNNFFRIRTTTLGLLKSRFQPKQENRRAIWPQSHKSPVKILKVSKHEVDNSQTDFLSFQQYLQEDPLGYSFNTRVVPSSNLFGFNSYYNGNFSWKHGLSCAWSL